MPFTLAHAAAALPFRRTRLVFSAVVFGSFAPDFEYFLRLGPWGKFGHSLPGLFAFDLPFGFLMLWLFHRYAKEPLWAWLPEDIRERVRLGPRRLPIEGATGLGLVLVSILVGAVTHILWDSFTHRYYWPYRHWPLLSYEVHLPVLGVTPYHKVFQYASTVIGLAVVATWFAGRVRAAVPEPARSGGIRRRNEWRSFWIVCGIAVAGGVIRALAGVRGVGEMHAISLFCAEAGISTISFFWVELVIYGFLRERKRARQEDAVIL